MRTIRAAGLLAAAFLGVGCISFTTVVKVKPDGSGTVTQTTVMGKEIVEMMKSLASMGDADKKGQAPELFSEKDARGKAAKMGPGVTFLSNKPVKTATGEGSEAVYAFKDISTLRLDEKPPSPGGPSQASASAEAQSFRFSRLPNGNAVLTVVSPQSKPKAADAGKKDKADKREPNKMPTDQELAQARKMLKGLRVAMAVEVAGTLVKTNSAYVEGNRVTLLEMDFEQLLGNEAKLRELTSLKEEDKGSMEAAKRILKGLPGFKFSLDPEVRIEFK
jgi:hypothetical protein